MTQSRLMQARIAKALGVGPEDYERVCPLIVITTSGDVIQDRRLLEVGGKALFVKEIEEAMLAGRIDCAVHSMKDVPAELPEGLVIAAIPEREDPRDAFISVKYDSIDDLPHGSIVGTASLRRETQLRYRRPDIRFELMRGNVETRLAKVERGEADGTFLAQAGINRLGLGHWVKEALDPLLYPPAPGQGALAIETRRDDAQADWLRGMHHLPTEICVAAERGALEALEGSCRTAIGAHARIVGDNIDLVVEAMTPNASQRFRREASVHMTGVGPARALGLELGRSIQEEAGARLALPETP